MMEGQETIRPAGGFATQRWINYQNRVAAFFAVSCLSESIGGPWLPRSPVQTVRCETGEPLADILLTFGDDGIAFIEVKRTIQLTISRMKPVLSQALAFGSESEIDSANAEKEANGCPLRESN